MNESLPFQPELVHEAHRNLHDFNNQIFRISLLADSLQRKIQTEQGLDEEVDAMIQRIHATITEVTQSGKNLAKLATIQIELDTEGQP